MTTPAARAGGERGFTLVELLVVVLIIGVLAAIALPAFLKQRDKAADSTAKSNARNLVSQIEVCWDAGGTGYVGCTAQLTTLETGLPIGSGPGEVRIVTETPTGYEITATSEGDTGGSHHTFTIVHNVGGRFERTCAPAGEGGCTSSASW